MKIINEAILPNKFIDNCGHYLSCKERPICLQLESIQADLSLYFILFKDLISLYGFEKYFEFLKKNTGINIVKHVKQGNTFFNDLIDMLKEENHIILVTNQFYDSRYTSSEYFKKSNHMHNIILRGYDSDKNEFLILDEDPVNIHSTLKSDYWPYSNRTIDANMLEEICVNIDFEEAIKLGYSASTIEINTDKYYTYIEILNTNNELSLNYYELFALYQDMLIERRNNYNVFKDQLIKNIDKFQNGTESELTPGEYPVILEMLYKHSDALHIQERFFMEVCRDKNKVTDLFSSSCSSFQNAYSYLIKYSYSKNSRYIEKTIELLKLAFVEEENLFDNILILIKELNLTNTPLLSNNNIGNDLIENPQVGEIEFNEKLFHYVDIKNNYNNIGFGSFDIHLECIANLTGMGHFFLPDSSISEKELTILKMKFKFPSIGSYLNDNISCLGQKLSIPNRIYRKICILGCSEYGSFEGDFKVKYKNGNSEKIAAFFSDWAFAPSECEHIVYEGFWSNKESRNEKVGKGKIFAQEHVLKSFNSEIESIILPDCPNIHIFAISLY